LPTLLKIAAPNRISGPPSPSMSAIATEPLLSTPVKGSDFHSGVPSLSMAMMRLASPTATTSGRPSPSMSPTARFEVLLLR
jgi:hypothetical protein